MRSFLCPYNQVRFKLIEISAMINILTSAVFKVRRSMVLIGLMASIVFLVNACSSGPVKPAPINDRSTNRQSSTIVAKPLQSVVKVTPISDSQVSTKHTDSVNSTTKENKLITQAKSDSNKSEVRSSAKSESKKELKVDKKDTPDKVPKIDATVPDADFKLTMPAKGQTVGAYNGSTNKGIDIAGKLGDPIYAASEGKVIFADNFKGYGNTLIVQHDNRYVTVYAHNKSLLVKEGQQVKRGQKIAEMGDSEAERVKLHFEIRRDGKSLDPSGYLQ